MDKPINTQNKVPAIRFQGFSGEWEERTLGSLCLIGDIDHRMPKSVGRGIPYLMTGDFIGNNGLDFDNAKLISVEDYNQLSKKIKPEKGDILLARYASVGAVRYVETDIKFTISYSCAILKNSKVVSFKYLYHCIQSDTIQHQIELKINAGSQRNIGIDSLNQISLFLPVSKEQTQIGDFFQALDDLIAKREQKHAKLRKIKQALLGKLFPQAGERVPQMRFVGFSGDWKERTLGELGETYTGLSGKTKEDFGHGEAAFVTYMNVFSNTVTDETLIEPIGIDSKQNQVKKGDVFFTTSSETPEEVGMSSVLVKDLNNVYLNSFCFGYRLKYQLDSHYLAYMLRSPLFRSHMVFLAQGMSRFNISKVKAMDITVKNPIHQEQTQIGNLFHKLDTLIDQYEQQITTLKNIKQGYLNKIFI